jgi:subtilisin family serine protease
MTATPLTADMTAAQRVECWHLLKPVEGALGINAVAAWRKSRGEYIKVVIFDTGVEFTHPSLAANISTGKDGLPDQAWDFDHRLDGKGRSIHEGGRIANPFDAHGTACAGIVGAADRGDTDVVGVAPKCSLVPVRINANFEPAALEAALERAASVGDVILLPRYLPRASVDKPKADLSERERKREEGLRSLERTLCTIATKKPVVCAAGNDGKKGLVFPACLPETIGVGACTEMGWRSTYSQYGENLDVVALSNDVPIETKGFVRLDKDEIERRVRDEQERAWLRDGHPILARPHARRPLEDTQQAKDGHLAEFGERAIATTDNLGGAGYNFDGDYCKADGTFGFGGTSAAAAQVAGVIALMLAKNSNLMGDVEAIRKQLWAAASKEYLRSNGNAQAEFGYGLVDAEKAVG